MQVYVLEFQSYTSVLHAHDLLSSNGILAEIEKSISTTSGCIYVLKIRSGYEAAANILSASNIPFTLKA
ncbi:MAG: DUF3343 domain-containing protein [Oscillospiraceae bacterium]|nr:DUF3343 domain-containing protein [Oscillospiraceae bacterium]